MPAMRFAAAALASLVALPVVHAQEGGESSGEMEVAEPPEHHPVPMRDVAAPARTPVDESARKKIQAFLVPADEAVRQATARVAAALEEELASSPGCDVVDLSHALSPPPPAADVAKASEARKLLADANLLLVSHAFGDAVTKYKAAVKAFEDAPLAVEWPEYPEAMARLAAAEVLAGDDDAGHALVKEVAVLDPKGNVGPASIDKAIAPLLEDARSSLGDAPSGTATVTTTPPGARVFVDGAYRGTAPLSSEKMPAGRHLFRVERAGYAPAAVIFDVVASDDRGVKLTLKPAPGAAELNALLSSMVREIGERNLGKSGRALAGKLGLERELIGSVTGTAQKVKVELALFDVATAQRIGRKTSALTADGTDDDRVEDATKELLRSVLAEGERTLHPQADMPGAEPAAAPAAASEHPHARAVAARPEDTTDRDRDRVADDPPPKKEKDKSKDKETGDPLKHLDGTEDW